MGKALFSDYFYQPSISFMQQITAQGGFSVDAPTPNQIS